MRISTSRKRVWILSFLLLIGFAPRLHQLVIPDLNIDETWSYINGFYLAHPTGYSAAQILAPEPNNALHLILLGLELRVLSGAFGVRWLSVILGMLTIALASRAAFRLYGRQAALVMALLVTLAYAPVTFSQLARPYMLATMLAVLSLVFWLEKRARLNMLASTLVPLAHIGAMPVVIVQDVLTLWRLLQHKRVNVLDWIVRRIPVYVAFLFVIYMAYTRRDIHVVSSGQLPPTPAELAAHFLGVISGGASTLSMLILLVGVAIPLVVIAVQQRQRLRNLAVPLLWIGVTYAMLIAGAVVSDGPIKWVHIAHIAIPIALLIAGILARAPRVAVIGVCAAFCVSSVLGLNAYFSSPDRYWSETVAAISPFRQADQPIYLQQPTIQWALQVNSPTATYITALPPEAERAPSYLYVDMPGWEPQPPTDCAAEPLWSDSTGLRLLRCERGQDSRLKL